MDNKNRNIVILGGGTAGWMAASALANHFRNVGATITLVESTEIGTVGVGEATLPGIRDFNSSLGIDEVEFIRATQATFKLGIEFNDWRSKGKKFFHPFSNFGAPIQGLDFYHCWLRSLREGTDSQLIDYNFSSQLALQGRFAQPHPNTSNPLANFHYAFHFDAVLYANFLRRYAERLGVMRKDARVHQVIQNVDTGNIESLVLDNGEVVAGDFFVDCSGFKGILIEDTLGTGYEDWSHWLPCNRAIAVQSTSTLDPTPFTKTTAKEAGWQWRIPLQHRVGNGYVYCSDYVDESTARATLLSSLDGDPITEPKLLKFLTGRRKKFWNKNCVALGLASGFMEPLESTSIALIQTGIGRLLQFFPWNGVNQAEIEEANRTSKLEFERIRDFLILHYKINKREDEKFWEYCRNMSIPDTLEHKINLFRSRGHLINHELESFTNASWITMYDGFGVTPEIYDKRVDILSSQELQASLQAMRSSISNASKNALYHQDFIKRHCEAGDYQVN